MSFSTIKSSKAVVVGALFSLLLAGCGGGGSSDTVAVSGTAGSDVESGGAQGIVLNGGAIKGVIRDGQVTAWRLEKDDDTNRFAAGAQLGGAVLTDQQGQFQLPISESASGWVLIELAATNQTRMTCDVVPTCMAGTPDAVAFGETFPLQSDFRLRAAINVDQSRDVYITPLSTLAVALAEHSAEGLSAGQLVRAYQEMESSFGLRPGTLQLPPPDLVRLNGFSGSTDAIQLAVINAAFLAMVDGDRWQSIEEVLSASEQAIQVNGQLSGEASGPSVDDLVLEAAVLSEGLKESVIDPGALSALADVSERTQQFYASLHEAAPEAAVARLSWTAPLTRINGESLSMGELKGYEIVYGRNANELNQRVVINDASVMSYTVDGLSEGDWYFAIRVLDTENLSSPLSAVVSKSI
tara:strand:- start:71536 stop:72768 length:1233 start_codon:yes stop_codon:yes gene_type:complete